MSEKKHILVSACLLGENCKWNAQNNLDEKVIKLKEQYDLVPVCPEVLGGLTTPRNPAEQKGDKVYDNLGNDVTAQFSGGAQKSLELARANNCKMAILKAKSPSCGTKKVYDGTFTKSLTDGNGVTAKLLIENGITVLNESEL